ncbi:sensor domain-containing protein [Williamsia soli]|uniref:sensor domain-containing protein n=1 Tax=Williamsia soli TaxID=364929 RepID=UPI001A9D3B1C|nr:EAL domain-containing protein [Williamsia soli]
MRGPEQELAILQALMERSPDLISLSEFSGTVRYLNPAGLELLGLSALPFDGSLMTEDFFTPEGLKVAGEVEHGLSTVGHWQGRSEMRHFATGEGIPVAISTFVVERDGDNPRMVASYVRDRRAGHVRDLQLLDAAASAAQFAAEQQAVAELSRIAISGDLPQLLPIATAAAATMMGVERSTITRVDPQEDAVLVLEAYTGTKSKNVSIPAGTYSLMGYTILRNAPVVCDDIVGETRFDTSAMVSAGLQSGASVPIAGNSGPWGALSVHSARPRSYGPREVAFLQTVAGVLSTAIRRIELDRRLRHRRMSDQLTGLPNREVAYECIDEALARARLNGTVVAVLLLDIDDFKIINDSLGHDTGDVALRHFARRLKSAIRPQDTVARLGGDEFLIICEGIRDVAHAQEIAHSITDEIRQPMVDDNSPTPRSASIGIAVSDEASTRRDLIHQADLAMYRAKSTGTGGHAVFDNADVYDAERIRTLSLALRKALIRGDQMHMVYQPIVEIDSNRIVAVEALARWNHPALGPIGPTEFVAVAERTGLSTELGMWALRTACTQAAVWRQTSDITIRVNVSALQLRDAKLPDQVALVLAATGLPPTALGLEITETVWVEDTERVADTLTELHRMGVGILLDDIGVGHSSISYLDRYPLFECFKIDQSFIARLPSPRGEAIISAIVSLANAFDVTVVAEGVETSEQLEALRNCGCQLAQGYLLGRPISGDATTELLRAQPD